MYNYKDEIYTINIYNGVITHSYTITERAMAIVALRKEIIMATEGDNLKLMDRPSVFSLACHSPTRSHISAET
jgi:hypothetical protein